MIQKLIEKIGLNVLQKVNLLILKSIYWIKNIGKPILFCNKGWNFDINIQHTYYLSFGKKIPILFRDLFYHLVKLFVIWMNNERLTFWFWPNLNKWVNHTVFCNKGVTFEFSIQYTYYLSFWKKATHFVS